MDSPQKYPNPSIGDHVSYRLPLSDQERDGHVEEVVTLGVGDDRKWIRLNVRDNTDGFVLALTPSDNVAPFNEPLHAA
jgi:hypothetical protein